MALESLSGAVVVHFGIYPLNERLNKKPSWAWGALIYRKRADEANYQMIAHSRTSPFYDTGISGPASDYTYVVRYQGKEANDIGLPSREETVAAGGIAA